MTRTRHFQPVLCHESRDLGHERIRRERKRLVCVLVACAIAGTCVGALVAWIFQ